MLSCEWINKIQATIKRLKPRKKFDCKFQARWTCFFMGTQSEWTLSLTRIPFLNVRLLQLLECGKSINRLNTVVNFYDWIVVVYLLKQNHKLKERIHFHCPETMWHCHTMHRPMQIKCSKRSLWQWTLAIVTDLSFLARDLWEGKLVSCSKFYLDQQFRF